MNQGEPAQGSHPGRPGRRRPGRRVVLRPGRTLSLRVPLAVAAAGYLIAVALAWIIIRREPANRGFRA